MIKLIWAMDENRLIGKDNLLPWNYPKDIKYYKEMTNNKRVIMGKNTYYSMKKYYKKLPYNEVFVASSSLDVLDDAVIVKDLDLFFQNEKAEIFVLGGSYVFQTALKYADVLHITYILAAHDGDTYFPNFNMDEYKLESYENDDSLIFATYVRSKK